MNALPRRTGIVPIIAFGLFALLAAPIAGFAADPGDDDSDAPSAQAAPPSPPAASAAPAPKSAGLVWPKEFRGLWFQGKSCDEIRGFSLTASTFTLSGQLHPQAEGKFGLVVFSNDILSETQPNRIVARLMRREADKQFVEIPSISEIKDGRKITYWQDRPNGKFQFQHCATVKTADPRGQDFIKFLRRAEFVFNGYSDLSDRCADPASVSNACIGAIVHLLDLNGDGKIAPAELTTFFRRYAGVGLLLGGKDGPNHGKIVTIDPADLESIEAGAAIFGPFLTNIVFANFDYGATGFLTADDIALGLRENNGSSGMTDPGRLLTDAKQQAAQAFTGLSELGQLFGLGPSAPKSEPGK
jgi:hypothetical protein